MNGKERVYYEKNYKLVSVAVIGSAVGLTASPLFTEVDKIHTSVGLWKITLYGQVGESV